MLADRFKVTRATKRCAAYTLRLVYLGRDVKNKLNPSFGVFLFRGHGFGRAWDGCERARRGAKHKFMRCTPHDLSKNTFDTFFRATFQTRRRTAFCAVCATQMATPVSTKSWFPTCSKCNLCGDDRTDRERSSEPACRLFNPKCDPCGEHHTIDNMRAAKW